MSHLFSFFCLFNLLKRSLKSVQLQSSGQLAPLVFEGGCVSLYESVSLLNHSSKTSWCSLTHLMLTWVCSIAWIIYWSSLRSLSAAKRFSCKHKHARITQTEAVRILRTRREKLDFRCFRRYITETLFGFPLYLDEWNVFCFSFRLQGVYNGVQGVYLTVTHKKKSLKIPVDFIWS